jgi:hypothetical protein
MASAAGRRTGSSHGRGRVLAVFALACSMLLLAGCAATANPAAGGSDSAGFWLGLWQGFIAPIAFLVSLFNHAVGIYEVHNNGAWYDFGYIVGLTIFFSGGTAGARTRPRSKQGGRA